MLSQNMCTLQVSVKKCLKRCKNHMQTTQWKSGRRCLCVYTCCMIRSHERRALGALVSLFSRSEPASTDSWLQSGCGEARRLRLRIVVVFIHSPRHRSLLVLVLLCVPRTAAVPGRLCSVTFLLERPMPFFDLIIRWVESSDFGPKSDDLGHRILKSVFIPLDLQNRTA